MTSLRSHLAWVGWSVLVSLPGVAILLSYVTGWGR